MRKLFTALMVLSCVVLLSYGSGIGADIVVENISGVSGASAAKLYYPRNISGSVGATTMSAGYTQTLNNVDWLSRALANAGFVVLGLTPSNNWGMVSGWKNSIRAALPG